MTEGREDNLPHLHLLAASFYMGILRLGEAGLFSAAALAAAHRIREHAKPEDAVSVERLAADLRDAEDSEIDAFSYLNIAMSLVYATALLDTFLSDMTRFLILLFPATLDDGEPVAISQLREATSLDELLNQVATSRVRSLSLRTFHQRLRFLRKRFKLAIQLEPATNQALEHYTGLRHAIVHDQSIVSVHIRGGELAVEPRGCPRHPTALKREDFNEAKYAYADVVRTIYRAIAIDVLGADAENRLVAGFGDAIQRGETSA